ncbi:MAG TPA: tetratricopeptide repeat protein [Myxococcales bacterium]|jgi:tetratricopeptide (TPR) repeat protein|nr:tetratricopeptide repeat protein [Myxococcales bacterium]
MYSLSKAAPLCAALMMVAGSSCDSPYFNRNDPARIHRNKGIEAFKKERWGDAADEWKLSLQAKPEQREMYEKLAFAEVKAGRLDDAAATLFKTQAFQDTDKQRLDVTRKVASMYLQNNKLDKAEHYFQEILKQEPNDAASLSWLGEIHSVLGGARAQVAPADLAQLGEAIGYYDKAMSIDPENITPVVNKRIALMKISNYWIEKKNKADADEAAAPRRDKKAKAEAHARGEEAMAKIDELKPQLDDLSAKVTALLEKRKAAQAAAAAADGGTGDGGSAGGGGSGADGGAAAPH